MPTSRFSPIKDQQVIVVCDSAAIAAGDISGMLSALKSLSSDRSSAMSAEGAVTLVFHGYDDDGYAKNQPRPKDGRKLCRCPYPGGRVAATTPASQPNAGIAAETG